MYDDDFTPDPDFVPDPGAVPFGRSHQRAYREALHAGPAEQPAGWSAPGPDLSAESHSPAQLAQDWGQVGKGMAKGVPATLAGGMAGDVEQMGRQLFKEWGVSQDTTVPTTTEGGYFGPKGAGWMDPAKTPEEAGGMNLSAMLAPGAMFKGARALRGAAEVPKPLPPTSTINTFTGREPPPKPVYPSVPEGSPVATVREGSGARLLEPDVPHVVPEGGLPQHSSAGAAGASILEDMTPEAQQKLKAIIREEFPNEWAWEQRQSEMSPHQSLAEASPGLEWHWQGVAGHAGEARNETFSFLHERAREAKDRLRAIFNTGIGVDQDVAQMRKTLDIDQKKAADPLYQRFKEEQIHPTPELKKLYDLFNDEGIIAEAKKFAKWQDKSWNENFFTSGPQKAYPTAESWDLIKQALDARIEDSFNNGRPTKWTRVYTDAKHKLLDAIDNHPNPEVRGLWREAREAFAGPEKIKSAWKLGEQILTRDVDAHELPFITAGHSEAEMAALRVGIRRSLEKALGEPGRTELPVMKKLLSENNQQKMRWALGDKQTEEIVKGIEHEYNMHNAPQRIIQGSPTGHRATAVQHYGPQQGPLSEVTLGDIGHAARHPIGTVMGKAADLYQGRNAAKATEQAASLRNQLSRAFTLQGPERDAIMRWALDNPDQGVLPFPGTGTAGRKKGGRVSGPPIAGARRAPDGNWYIRDKKRPGKFLRVDQHA